MVWWCSLKWQQCGMVWWWSLKWPQCGKVWWRSLKFCDIVWWCLVKWPHCSMVWCSLKWPLWHGMVVFTEMTIVAWYGGVHWSDHCGMVWWCSLKWPLWQGMVVFTEVTTLWHCMVVFSDHCGMVWCSVKWPLWHGMAVFSDRTVAWCGGVHWSDHCGMVWWCSLKWPLWHGVVVFTEVTTVAWYGGVHGGVGGGAWGVRKWNSPKAAGYRDGACTLNVGGGGGGGGGGGVEKVKWPQRGGLEKVKWTQSSRGKRTTKSKPNYGPFQHSTHVVTTCIRIMIIVINPFGSFHHFKFNSTEKQVEHSTYTAPKGWTLKWLGHMTQKKK